MASAAKKIETVDVEASAEKKPAVSLATDGGKPVDTIRDAIEAAKESGDWSAVKALFESNIAKVSDNHIGSLPRGDDRTADVTELVQMRIDHLTTKREGGQKRQGIQRRFTAAMRRIDSDDDGTCQNGLFDLANLNVDSDGAFSAKVIEVCTNNVHLMSPGAMEKVVEGLDVDAWKPMAEGYLQHFDTIEEPSKFQGATLHKIVNGFEAAGRLDECQLMFLSILGEDTPPSIKDRLA